MKFNTKTIHGGQDNIDPAYNSVMQPIYQTTTYAQTSPGNIKVMNIPEVQIQPDQL